MYISGLSNVEISGSSFLTNYAIANGGAIFASEYASVSIRSTKFTNNDAGAKGGDIVA